MPEDLGTATRDVCPGAASFPGVSRISSPIPRLCTGGPAVAGRGDQPHRPGSRHPDPPRALLSAKGYRSRVWLS